MKRFYSSVELMEIDGQFEIHLDKRPIRTPKKRAFHVPNKNLAEAIRKEWKNQGDVIDIKTMPLTGFAYAALDTIKDDTEQIRSEISRYCESDLLCYRPEGPEELRKQIDDAWDPPLRYALQNRELEFKVTTGVMHIKQPADTIANARKMVDGLTLFELSPFLALTAGLGSIVLAFAIYDKKIPFQTAWKLSQVEEAYQMQQWGEDAEAIEAAKKKRDALQYADQFLSLLSSDR